MSEDIEMPLLSGNEAKKKFPYEGDPLQNFEDPHLYELFRFCQLEEFVISDIKDQIEKVYLNKSPLYSIADEVDLNGMNLLHVLLSNGTDEEFFVKNLNKTARKAVVEIFKLIYDQVSLHKFQQMVVQKDNNERTPLHYASLVDDDNDEDEESGISLFLSDHGANLCLFQKDGNAKAPLEYISTFHLEKHLNSLCIIRREDQKAITNIKMFR